MGDELFMGQFSGNGKPRRVFVAHAFLYNNLPTYMVYVLDSPHEVYSHVAERALFRSAREACLHQVKHLDSLVASIRDELEREAKRLAEAKAALRALDEAGAP
jgi:hypothetical protein